MEPTTVSQIESFWPDVAGPFAEVVPHGCDLVRTEDDWHWRPSGALRVRTLELAPRAEGPDLELLLDECVEDAIREGWTALHEDGEPLRFELENVILRVATVKTPLLLGSTPALRVSFEQPWPAEAGPPVETSEMFQNLVRNLLHLAGEPQRLVKEVVLDPHQGERADILRERVEMPADEDLVPRFDELSFSPPSSPGEPWSSRTTSGPYSIEARVVRTGERVRVDMDKVRLVS